MSSQSQASEMAIISANLNSTLLLVFLMGTHTIIYLITVYLYATRKPLSGKLKVILTITLLYGLTVGQLILQWWYTNWSFVTQAQSLNSIVMAAITGTPAIAFFSSTLQYTGYFLANGLLVWRCFHACGGALSRIVIPFTCFICEIGFCIAVIIMDARLEFQSSYETHKSNAIFNIVNGTLNIVTAMTSVSATFLICRRISYSSGSSLTSSRRRYARTVRMLIESSFLYSVSVVGLAITLFLETYGTGNDSEMAVRAYVASSYIDAIVIISSGIAPTLMVAQVALSSKSASSSYGLETKVLSHLRFNESEQTSEGTSGQSTETFIR